MESINKSTPPILEEVRDKYSSLDGLRAYAAVGIVLMVSTQIRA